jgi:N-acylneuraminate cytidylyltransferase
MENDKILCIIPARGGSKRLPRKSIKLLQGIPLIGYAIRAAKDSKYVHRVIVSTDDEEIKRVAEHEGAEVPFMRPAELATDDALIIPVLEHAVQALEEGSEKYDLIVLIQPTTPGVRSEDVDAAIEKIKSAGTNSCISMTEITDRPEWMYSLQEDGKITPYTEAALTSPFKRSQELPELYRINGAVYVVRHDVLMHDNVLVDNKSCAAVLMPKERSIDIDTLTDFTVAEALLPKT